MAFGSGDGGWEICLIFPTVIAGKEVRKFSLTSLMSVDMGGLNRAVGMHATVLAMVVEGRTAFTM